MRPPKTWLPSVPFIKAPSNFAKFETLEAGITACTELYNRFYKDLNSTTLVNRWTANGAETDYKNAIKSCYL